jgi:putative ABC transport system permease protein
MNSRMHAAVRAYRALLWMLLPRHVRGRFMSDAVDVFTDVARDARTRGPLAPWSALVAELPGIARLAVARRTETARDLYLPVVEEQTVGSSLSQDLRYAARALRLAPGFSIVAIVTLALGIGANTAIFSVVNGILLKPLSIREPDRVVVVAEAGSSPSPANYSSTSAANFYDWKNGSKTMQLAAMVQTSGTLTGKGEPQRLLGAAVHGDFFDVIGVKPIFGRIFVASDEVPENERVILLSHGMWTQHYSADTAILGKTLMLNGTPRRIVGVMPRDLRFPDGASEFWVPLRLSAEDRANHDQYYLTPIGRLRSGATIGQARAEMAVLATRLKREWPIYNSDLRIIVYPVVETMVSGIRTQLWVLMGAVGFVLLITCANLGNLLMARATARRRELAVRQALGAGRRRIAQQLLTESLLLASIGALLGLGLGKLFLRMILAAQATLSLPRVTDIALDARVLAFTLAIGLVAGLFFGTFPIWELGKARFSEVLRAGNKGSAASRGMRDVLVVSQLALAMILLTGAGLLLRSFSRMQQVDPGFSAAHVLTFSVTANGDATKFFPVALDRLRAIPGVSSAALITQLPMTGRGGGAWFNRIDQPVPAGKTPDGEIYRIVTPDIFTSLGLRIQQGRALETTDGPNVRSVVVNQALAAKYYPGEDAIGKKIYLGAPDNRVIDDATIVGIAQDTYDAGAALPALPIVYVPYTMVPRANSFAFVVRAEDDPRSLIASARAAIQSVDANAAIRDLRTMDDVVAASFAPARWSTTLLGVFALVALIITVVGIFGVLSFIVAQRTRELGIRIALGASSSRVQRLVVGRALTLAGAGLAVGTAGSLALTRWMTSLLFGVTPTDLPTFVTVGAGLLGMALLASYLPARRATRIDPLLAIRSE